MNTISRRQFGLFAGAGVLAAASRAYAGAAVAPAFDPTPYVHPELRPLMAQIRKVVSGEPLTSATLAARRKMNYMRPPQAAPAYVERMIPGRKGDPDVRVYVINAGAAGAAPRAAILHTHGGGFVLQDAKAAIGSMQELALALDCVIVTVDYRLAPETRFPGALEDNYAGLKWLYANAAELGVDKTRIAVMGESAGGGHAAMLAIAARDRGEVPLAYQALIYPMLDDRTGSTRQMPAFMGMIIWNSGDNRFGWTSLLGVPAGSRRVPYGSVPARVSELRGLPPTFIGVGSIDLFADEDIEYARRLIVAGVATELNVVPGAFHGFDGIGGTDVAKQFRAALISAMKQGLKPKE
jgi:acetyl esterase/lipase